MDLRSGSEPERRYQEAVRLFGAHEDPVPHDRDQALTVLERSRFTQAQAIAASRQLNSGLVSDQTRDYVDTQNITFGSEAVGVPFRNKIRLTFNGHELVDQKGDSHRQSLRVATIGALAMAKRDKGYEFYARRTFYDYKFANDFEQMVRDESVPAGSVIGLVSPCEMDDRRHAVSIGMSPAREMAVVQYARKADSKTLELMTISLDRADLALLRELLASHGIELPGDIEAEDVLGYTFTTNADTSGDFENLVRGDIQAFDASLTKRTGQPMRQGQFIDEKNNPKDIPWGELQGVIDMQFAFDEAMSWAAMPGPRDLHPLLRQHAQAALATLRPDGQPLLNDHEQALLKQLLSKKTASLDDIADAEAFLILKNIQDTAIVEIIRQHMAGDREIVQRVQVAATPDQPVHSVAQAAMAGSNTTVTVGGALTYNLMQVAAEAAQAGRFAGACGNVASFGEGGGPAPSVFAAGQMSSVVGMIMRGEDTSFLVPDNAPLAMKYGQEKVHYGHCDCCDDYSELGPCSVCNSCDTLDRMEPGYIERRKARKEVAAALASA